ncbi:alpha-L-fucosidase [Lactobacillus sp. ESL0679]|uniref:alpha-L-fucosidase n=1 Tax=Lactobacillus sp. ESL0679 TaxID=2983209 RepID=UPI0023F7FA17|nr:alpha-L-fucosidase [Lactobacillus sp. ESL0679]MDF7683268.1 alpha-L-fucosidase [Lactobacillus sp. ESL0679]
MIKVFPRIKKFEKMGIGLFIHWGLYSQLSQGEWTEYIHHIDRDKYEKLINTFSAKDFNAKKIVAVAKQMGAKYIVLTTKHHEGFFLYDTHGLSNFDVMHSPAHRDLIQEFVSACRDADIAPFFYVATYDWHSELYHDHFNEYLDYLLKSVKLLCKNYGKISGFWFDGNWDKKDADWQLPKLYGTIRKYQPKAIIINNTGLENGGQIVDPEIDVVTYERQTPNKINHGFNNKYLAGESSITMNNHWGYAQNDLNFKSVKELIENIVHIRGIGANILINIGLTGTGTIPLTNQAIMQEIGKWTNTYSEAIYNTHPLKDVSASGHTKDLVLGNTNNSYLFIHDLNIVGDKNVVLGGEGINLRSFTGFFKKIKRIIWLDNNAELYFMHDPNSGILTIDTSGYTYGTDWCVRVAKIIFED